MATRRRRSVRKTYRRKHRQRGGNNNDPVRPHKMNAYANANGANDPGSPNLPTNNHTLNVNLQSGIINNSGNNIVSNVNNSNSNNNDETRDAYFCVNLRGPDYIVHENANEQMRRVRAEVHTPSVAQKVIKWFIDNSTGFAAGVFADVKHISKSKYKLKYYYPGALAEPLEYGLSSNDNDNPIIMIDGAPHQVIVYDCYNQLGNP